ncbi:MAG: RDD family protein [Bacteroidales bacterium]
MKKTPKNEKIHIPHLERLRSLDGIPLAGFRSRTIAFVIDIAIISVIVVLIGLPAAFSNYHSGITKELVIHFEPFHNLNGIITSILYFGALTYIWRGKTIGKHLLKIRVISLKNDNLTLWQSIERFLGYGASALEGGFGFFQAIWYENRQSVHDRIAETVVVKVLK